MTSSLSAAQQLHLFEVESARLLDSLDGADLSVPVPSCPGWALRDLVRHLGGVYGWAAAKLPGAGRGRVPVPDDDHELYAWFSDASAYIGQRLHAVSPDEECWTFDGSGRAAFWLRRMPQETAVHRWDAQASLGNTDPFDVALAADGIAEIIDMYYPLQVSAGHMKPLTDRLRIETTDAATVELLGDSDSDGNGDGDGDEPTISGPAEAVLLVLWKRVGLDDARITITGSTDVVAEILAQPIVP